MNRRVAFVLLVSSAVLAAGGGARAGDISVYGLELEVSEERERLLIFADAPLEPQLLSVDERTLMIALPGSRLDASAPTQITPSAAGTIARVTAFDRADPPPEVRVVVQRRPGAPPRIERRASVIAIDFEPLPRAAPARDDTIQISYRDAPIGQVITDLARATGEALVFDDSVTALGAVTIEGPPQASRGEALALIDSLLLLRGYAAVPAPGGVRKIIPINGAPSAWAPDGRLPDSDAPVTTLLRLETVEAVDLVPILTPYLGAHSTATAFAPTNSLILSGPSSLLRTLRTAIDALDEIETGDPLIWPMRYASARTVADQVLEIAGERDVPYASSDERLNAVLLRVRPGEVDHVRALVDRLDRPPRGAGGIHVLKLRYADPERLVEQLHALRDASSPTSEAALAPFVGGLRGRAFEVVADVPSHSLVVRAPPETIDAVLDVVAEVDRVPVTVRLDITIAALQIDDRLDLGADFLIPSLTHVNSPDDIIATIASNPSGGGIQTLPSPEKPFVFAYTKAPLLVTLIDPTTGNPFTISIPRESASLTLNDREVRTDMLMRPRLLITSGEEHELFAGDNIPIPVAQTEEAGTTGARSTLQTRQNVERQDVGTTLRVTPTVGVLGGVQLELLVEVSSLGESLAGDVEEVGPSIREIRVESKIRLRDGEVAVVATAARPTTMRAERGIPWLKDIPVLGWAFRATVDQSFKRHLLIAARADIVRADPGDLAARLASELSPPAPAARANP